MFFPSSHLHHSLKRIQQENNKNKNNGGQRVVWTMTSSIGVIVLLFAGWLPSTSHAFQVVPPALLPVSFRVSLVVSTGGRMRTDGRSPSTGRTWIGRVGAEVPRGDTTRLFSRKGNGDGDDNDSSSDVDNSNAFPFLAVVLPLVGLVTLWPLLALFRDTNDPTSGFDIDMFMALKGILGSNEDGLGMGRMGNVDTIMELPSLSPAEQLVGAIFGPP